MVHLDTYVLYVHLDANRSNRKMGLKSPPVRDTYGRKTVGDCCVGWMEIKMMIIDHEEVSNAHHFRNDWQRTKLIEG
jgi:hypothetical protein